MTITNKKLEKEKIPFWLAILFTIASLFFLTTVGLYAYQKSNQNKQKVLEKSELFIQQLGILKQDDLININWLHTLNPIVRNVQGRLLWSTKKQLGVMEFVNLPELQKNQRYHLLISDLSASNNKPISAIIDKHTFQQKGKTIIPFKAEIYIKTPFKFELMLKNKEEGEEQPLLLAQP